MPVDKSTRSRIVLGALAASVCVLACSTRDRAADSTSSSAAARGDSIGDLSGAPRPADLVAGTGTTTPTTTGPSGAKSSAGAGKTPPAATKTGATTSSTSAPVAPTTSKPAADTGAQRRNDGSMLNPPIHRTNPDAGTGEPAFDLMTQINALAKTTGCANASDCQTLPVGRKACGGPRTYVVFCAKSTNVALLKAKIAELDRVELAASKNTVSDCMMVMAPRVTLSGGACRASSAGTVEVH